MFRPFGKVWSIVYLSRVQWLTETNIPLRTSPPGDLTDHGYESEWKQFVEQYGLTGKDGLLKYPVQECTGNHDIRADNNHPVLAGVRQRHGSLVRQWIWQGVCFISLNCAPDSAARTWLTRQLKTLGRKHPIVLFLHYSIKGPYSNMWSDQDKAALADVIRAHNIVAIFHGHYHLSEHYTWEGFDIYNVGSPRHACHSFAAAHITDNELSVASLFWDAQPSQWYWSHRKTITTTPLKRAKRQGKDVGLAFDQA